MTPVFEIGRPLRVMVPLSGRLVACDAKVLASTENVLETTPPRRHLVRIPINVESLEVMVLGDALYRTVCSVVAIADDKLTLRPPADVERIQRREHVRVPVTLPAKIAAPFGGQLLPFASAEFCNLSPTGCALFFDVAVDLEARVTITFGLPAVGAYVLRGVTRYCMRVQTLTGLRYQIGIEFIEVSEGDRQRLARFVREVERKLVRSQTAGGTDVRN